MRNDEGNVLGSIVAAIIPCLALSALGAVLIPEHKLLGAASGYALGWSIYEYNMKRIGQEWERAGFESWERNHPGEPNPFHPI